MSASQEKKRLYEQLSLNRQRRLGEGNELVLLAYGPGCLLRVLFGVFLCLGTYMGVFNSVMDLFIDVHSKTGTALVTGVAYTEKEVDEDPVYVIDFSYELDGKTYANYGYSISWAPNEGEQLQIRYSSTFPHLSRPVRGSFGLFGRTGSLICLGLLSPLLFFGLRGMGRSLTWRKLLRYGLPQWACLVEKKATGVLINEKPVYKLTFAFDLDGETHSTIIKAHDPDVLKRVTDEEEVLLLYLPDNPEKSALWDHFPYAYTLEQPNRFAPPDRKEIRNAVLMLLLTYGTVVAAVIRFLALFKP